jgi:hypothetical protein
MRTYATRCGSARYRAERDELRRERDAMANQLLILDERNRRLEASVEGGDNIVALRRR